MRRFFAGSAFASLYGYCNPSAGPATLTFLGVQNLDAVRQALESARQQNAGRGYIDEVVDTRPEEGRGYFKTYVEISVVLTSS
jgi:hypothetical protein